MQVTLTPRGEELLKKQLADNPNSTPEQILEKALETLPQRTDDDFAKTPAEAVDRILALQRKGLSLRGLNIKGMIEEGRRF